MELGGGWELGKLECHKACCFCRDSAFFFPLKNAPQMLQAFGALKVLILTFFFFFAYCSCCFYRREDSWRPLFYHS